MREIIRENLSSGFPTKRVSNQSPRLKIEVLLVAILDTTFKKVDNKVADETARMRRLICAFIVTNHQRHFFSVAVQSLHKRLESKMRNLIFMKNDITQTELLLLAQSPKKIALYM